ncbi:primosomal protein N' [Candidatus Saccharibacteria bacterium]|nr:MAG: primosomal protein N' [Candidatus Saccharibacteria bacterium]
MHYFEVAPNIIVRQDAASYTYNYPEVLTPGQIVKTPIGKRSAVGVVTRQVDKPAYDTKAIFEVLDASPLPPEIVKTASWLSDYYGSHPAQVWQTILPANVFKKRRLKLPKTDDISKKRTKFVLNEDQLSAIKKIDQSSTKTILLHGVTGSGKTQVYIEAIRRQIEAGRSAIVLVPEISLTSQIYQEFASQFDNIVLTHSRQTEAERHLLWTQVLDAKQPMIVIGPRSALFMPLKSIGLIVIDECHEPSYKQEKSPRYSALRAAKVLADFHGANLVLGSATPNIEDYYVATKTKNPIMTMPTPARHQTQKPSIQVIDMTKRENFRRQRFLSDALLASLEKNLSSGHQSLIFHNRRGTASLTLCESCGWQAGCPRCFIPLTLHADKYTLTCHICTKTIKVPTCCPDCRHADIIHKGIGTKAIEEAIKKLLPDARVARFDGDNLSDSTLEKRFSEVKQGDIDIIIGTQIIAKGLDLPKLRTVGIVQADAGLSLPDYTSTERAFQLLSQAIGRVGRSNQSTNVIIQTFQPKNQTIVDALDQNYDNFYQRTIKLRRQTNFPPFCFLLKAVCLYKTEKSAIKNAQKLAKQITSEYQDIEILGPTPAFYERQRDFYRWQIVIKSKNRQQLVEIAKTIPKTHWQYELDPTNLL